jgi:hypothetical protein
MKNVLILLALFFITFLFGQLPNKNIHKNVKDLTIVESISSEEIADGFYITDGFSSSKYKLESGMVFKKINSGCVSSSIADSGTWYIKNHNNIVLKSKKTTLCFEIIKFHEFNFFVLPTQLESFIVDVQAAEVLFKDAKPIVMKDRTYTVSYRIGKYLREKYFANDLTNFD